MSVVGRKNEEMIMLLDKLNNKTVIVFKFKIISFGEII